MLRASNFYSIVVLIGDEVEGQAVHTKTLTGRSRTVGEQVAEVRPATTAADLGADHAVRTVLDEFDGVGSLGLEEARPTTARLELGGRVEQLGAARRAVIRAVGMLVDVLAAPGALGAGMSEHFVLLRAP